MSGLFSPLDTGRLKLRNRLGVAPMTRVSATADGHATARMREYYGAFAEGNVHRSGTRGPSPVRPNGQQMAFYRAQAGIPIAEFDRSILSPIADLANADLHRSRCG